MKQRFFTGIFIVLATALAIVAKLLPYNIGDYVFDIFAIVIAIIAGFEMSNIMEKMGKKTNKILTTFYSIFNYAILIVSLEFLSFEFALLIELCALILYYIIAVIWQMVSNKENGFKQNLIVGLNVILSCIYPGFMFCLIIAINHADVFAGVKHFSMLFIILIFAITYFTDTFAYLVGRTFKGPKLAPKVSPNKTISGAIGGLLGGIGAAMLLYLIASKTAWNVMLTTHSICWWHFLIVGALGSIIGQCGDLFESALKRKAGIKDSGNLFPGHGGMLDRYDALTFVTTFIYIFMFIVLIV